MRLKKDLPVLLLTGFGVYYFLSVQTLSPFIVGTFILLCAAYLFFDAETTQLTKLLLLLFLPFVLLGRFVSGYIADRLMQAAGENGLVTSSDWLFLQQFLFAVFIILLLGSITVLILKSHKEGGKLIKKGINIDSYLRSLRLPEFGTFYNRVAGIIPSALTESNKPKPRNFDLKLNDIELLQHDRYLHSLIVGTIGTGKSSRLLKPMIYQDLEKIAEGAAGGITVIEPKGDLTADVAEMAESFGLPVTYINPEDPNTPKFNPLEGEPYEVAEITRTVLQAMFGEQDNFFRQAQETVAKNTVLLLKMLHGDNVTLYDIQRALQDISYLEECVKELEKRGGKTALTQFFREDLLKKDSELRKHISGLRLQLEDITNNNLLRRVLGGKSDVNLDYHLAQGGVLVINTAMGRLAKLGDLFGQFVILHFQGAVFRRPGNERTRIPHFLYIDEAPRYMNPQFELLLAIGRSYRCAVTMALQNTAQLLLDAKPAFRDIVLETCRNKFILNLGSADDAKRFSAEFGETIVTKDARTYKRRGPIFTTLIEDSVRQDEKLEPRIDYTDLMELPEFTCAYRIVRNGKPLPPGITKLDLCPFDKQRDKREKKTVITPDSATLYVPFGSEESEETVLDGENALLQPVPAQEFGKTVSEGEEEDFFISGKGVKKVEDMKKLLD